MFSQDELQTLVVKMEEEIRKSEERRQTIMENIDVEEECKEIIEDNVKMEHNIEDDLKIEIANMFGKLFQAHGEGALGIFNYIYQNHIIPCIQNPSKINMEYALYLIDDSIEYLGQWISPEIKAEFARILI